jgi:Na+-translocating ferredoxin:NAD+ oxidoreductase RnfG subunit
VALAVVGLLEEVARQVAHIRTLTESALRLQQFYARQESAVLVLPAATCGEQLLEYECAVSNLGLVPAQSAEIIDGTQHRRCQYTTCTQSAACGYGGQQCDLESAPEIIQLLFQ